MRRYFLRQPKVIPGVTPLQVGTLFGGELLAGILAQGLQYPEPHFRGALLDTDQ